MPPTNQGGYPVRYEVRRKGKKKGGYKAYIDAAYAATVKGDKIYGIYPDGSKELIGKVDSGGYIRKNQAGGIIGAAVASGVGGAVGGGIGAALMQKSLGLLGLGEEEKKKAPSKKKGKKKKKSNPRYVVVGKPRMKKGYWGVLDTVKNQLVISVTTKSVAQDEANKFNRKEGLRNPSSAQALAEDFHGRPSKGVTEFEEVEKYDGELADLGGLVELHLALDDDKEYVEVSFSRSERNQIRVAANPEGTQIYFIGGDQTLNVEDDGKTYVPVGVVDEIVYFADKHHLEGPEEQKRGMQYRHGFGEESGVKPLLVYNTVSQTFILVGGNYEVKSEGIVD